jgi:threonine aldolase
LETLPHYGRPATVVAGLFDSVYLSLYKGLGGLAGCVLAGDEQLVAEAKEWRLRHGGRLFAMWPYAAAGLAGLRRRAPLMAAYGEHARAITAELAELDGVTVTPDPPVTNMAHLYLRADADRFASATRHLAQEEKFWTWGEGVPADLPSHLVVELTVGDATMEMAPPEVRETIAHLLERSQPDQTA